MSMLFTHSYKTNFVTFFIFDYKNGFIKYSQLPKKFYLLNNSNTFSINIILRLLKLILNIRQFLVLLYDCAPNMKHVWSIGRLLKNANVLNSGTYKNPTTSLYSEKSENFSNLKKIIKMQK